MATENEPTKTDGVARVPTLSEQATALAARSYIKVAGARYNVKAQITRTVLRQIADVPFAVKFESAAFESEALAGDAEAKGRDGPRKPPRIAHVINLENGDKQVLIMNTVLEGDLKKHFPDDGYIDHSFLIRGTVPIGRDGLVKTYRVYQIIEIELENTGETSSIIPTGENPVNATGVAPGKHKPKAD